MKVYKDVRLADPFLRPYWRHERVVKMLGAMPPERCRRFDDTFIQQYRKFLVLWNKGESYRRQLLYENPGLYYAFQIYDKRFLDPQMAILVEARLLTGAAVHEIAEELKTIPETVSYYEKLFFNVQDFLNHRDWIVKQVIIPASDVAYDLASNDNEDSDTVKPKKPITIADPQFDWTLKYFAYFGGPLICDIMVHGFQKKHVTKVDELADFFNDNFKTTLMRRSAQATHSFEINKYNVMELFTTHSRLIEIQRSDRDQDGRHNEFEKHITAMLSEIQWSTGRDSKQRYKGSPIEKYDEGAIEIDADESVFLGAGIDPKTLSDIPTVSVFDRKEPDRNAKSK